MCVCGISGEYLLFCKGADSSIFPRVVSGKVEQVKARVEQNAVVSVKFRQCRYKMALMRHCITNVSLSDLIAPAKN